MAPNKTLLVPDLCKIVFEYLDPLSKFSMQIVYNHSSINTEKKLINKLGYIFYSHYPNVKDVYHHEPIVRIFQDYGYRSINIAYLLQDARFENALLEIIAYFYRNNKKKFNQWNRFLFNYYMFKLSNRFVNTTLKLCHDGTNEFNFSLIPVKMIRWFLENLPKKLIVLEDLPLAVEEYKCSNKTRDIHQLKSNISPIINTSKLQFLQTYLRCGFTVAGGASSALLYNHYKPRNQITFGDVDLWHFELTKGTTFINKIENLKQSFMNIALSLILVTKKKTSYWSHKVVRSDQFMQQSSSICYDAVVLTNHQVATLDLELDVNTDITDETTINKMYDVCEQHIQFISISFNHTPSGIESAISCLLMSFDLSCCQSAIYPINGNYHPDLSVVCTFPFLYSLATDTIFFNKTQHGPSELNRISKYEDRWRSPIVFSNTYSSQNWTSIYCHLANKYYFKLEKLFHEPKKRQRRDLCQKRF